jgi:hypothetical protein
MKRDEMIVRYKTVTDPSYYFSVPGFVSKYSPLSKRSSTISQKCQ